MGTMVQFPMNGSTGNAYLATPASGSGSGVVVIQEWWGLVDHIKDVANRFAGAGFVALAPDFYDGRTTTSPDEAGKLMMALNIDGAELIKSLHPRMQTHQATLLERPSLKIPDDIRT